MGITELLTMDFSLDWLWRRLPSGWNRFDEILDLAHFTSIINGAVLLLAHFMVPSAFNVFDPVYGPDLKTFAVHLLWLSLPIWCLIFGVRYRNNIRGRY